MKIKTSEATGLQLDWGLAVAHDAKHISHDADGVYVDDGCFAIKRDVFGRIRHAAAAVCMRLIKEYGTHLFTFTLNEQRFWDATISGAADARGCDTPEIAVARCVIAMRLGDEFEVPDELGVV